jgi:hypothetical protein
MNTIEKKSVKVGKYVSTEHVDNLIRNYKKERWMQNSEKLGKEDSLGVWLSAEELEEFVQTARMHGADGIRIYFGVYGENSSRPENAGKQTIAMVATRTEQVDANSQVNNDLYIDRDGKSSLLAYNMYPLFPSVPGTVPPLGVTLATDKNNRVVVM